MSSIAWMMKAWSFVGDAPSCAGREFDLMELFVSVWLENWKHLYSEVPLACFWSVYSYLRYYHTVFLLGFEIGVCFLDLWVGTLMRDCIRRPCGTAKPRLIFIFIYMD